MVIQEGRLDVPEVLAEPIQMPKVPDLPLGPHHHRGVIPEQIWQPTGLNTPSSLAPNLLPHRLRSC